MLGYLNKLNVESLKVTYDTFHLPELRDMVDVRADFLLWLQDPGVSAIAR